MFCSNSFFSLLERLPFPTCHGHHALIISAFFFTATVAVVKSRDMHWGLLAQKDHKDINLSTLRMLLVADGSNPCKNTHFFKLLTSEFCVLIKFCSVNHSNYIWGARIPLLGVCAPQVANP